jgi:hypothetical protein
MDQSHQIEWEDIAGLEHAKRSIREMVIFPMMRPYVTKYFNLYVYDIAISSLVYVVHLKVYCFLGHLVRLHLLRQLFIKPDVHLSCLRNRKNDDR